MSIIRNILAVIIGGVVGSIVNMLIIMASGSIIPSPEGIDVTNFEVLKASIHLFEPKHFIMPFLAHSLGAFSGALVAGLIAASHKMQLAMTIGVFFLIGGIMAVYMLPAPMWYNILDLGGAYLPMAYLAGKIATRKKGV